MSFIRVQRLVRRLGSAAQADTDWSDTDGSADDGDDDEDGNDDDDAET